MRAFLTLFSLLTLLGCSHQRIATPSDSQARIEPYSDMRPAGDAQFSADEQRIVATAQAHLEKSLRKRLDARYRVERTKQGYEVFVMFVVGYEGRRPLYGNVVAFFRVDGVLLKYMPGSARVRS